MGVYPDGSPMWKMVYNGPDESQTKLIEKVGIPNDPIFGGDQITEFAKLLKEMQGKTNRKAAFECVLSIAVPSGPALTYEARCEGLVAEQPVGQSGFGYDPIFFYPPLKKTFGQMTRAEKSHVSHRGKALKELKQEFDKVLIWIRRHMPLEEKLLYKED